MSNLGTNTGESGLFQSKWLEHKPEQTDKVVSQAWKEQYALINALYEGEATQEEFEDDDEATKAALDGYDVRPEFGKFKGGSKFDNTEMLEKVRVMKDEGDLQIALDHLSSSHDDESAKAIRPDVIVKVAQLLSIMDSAVYLRDEKAEKRVRESLMRYQKDIEEAMDSKPPKRLPTNIIEAMNKAVKQVDDVTEKIRDVARAMTLNYVPLCNFSSNGTLLRNGPYCGAFYKDSNGDNKDFIVVAFKGTGTKGEIITDVKIAMKATKDASPLRGHCHTGFFDGVYKNFPGELSADKKISVALPFQLLRNQLWRLAQTIQGGRKLARKVPVWVTGHSLGGAYATHCWQGLLATSSVNAHNRNRIVRDLFTFGCPRIGDKEFASYPNSIREFQRSWRFVNSNDLFAKHPTRWFKKAYYHLDTMVHINAKTIEIGKSELGSMAEPKMASTGEEGEAIGLTAHTLESYWQSLRSGRVVDPDKWPKSSHRGEESQPDRPVEEALAIWSLDDHHEPEFIPSKPHKDHSPEGQESVEDPDTRMEADFEDFDDNGKYRSVVKIQSMFGTAKDHVWTMGTGWLIRPDLVVTAGHNVFSKSYGGQARRIKCWIGYNGRANINEGYVQHRKAVNIVTTGVWYTQAKNDRRLRDVALIQVSKPFEGQLKIFSVMETPSKINNENLIVVGYPGDLRDDRDNADIGAHMWYGKRKTICDIGKGSHMIEYKIDTYGGQSGAPILYSPASGGTKVIGTHCYGGGPGNANSGNPIRGKFGNHLEDFTALLEGSNPEHPTPIASITPQFRYPKEESGPRDGDDHDNGAESFWDIFRTVAKIGAVALPGAGAFLGPVGSLLGTVAGGVLGSLSESVPETSEEGFTVPSEDQQELHIQRAQLAEATLQSVLRLGHSGTTNEVFKTMEELWNENRYHTLPRLGQLISPVLTDYGFLMATDRWEKEVSPRPNCRYDHNNGIKLEQPEKTESGHPNAAFVEALFAGNTQAVDGIPDDDDKEESLKQWLAPLMQRAITMAKPLATKAATLALDAVIKRLTKSGGEESLPSPDEQDRSFQLVIRRAIMADCALQAVEQLDKKKLQDLRSTPSDEGGEEGIIDSIKTRTQLLGPFALKYAKMAVKKYFPVLLGQLRNTIAPESAPKKTYTRVAGAKAHALSPTFLAYSGNLKNLGAPKEDDKDDDDNPDAPVEEPSSPPSPVNDLSTLLVVDEELDLSAAPRAAPVSNKRSFNAVA